MRQHSEFLKEVQQISVSAVCKLVKLSNENDKVLWSKETILNINENKTYNFKTIRKLYKISAGAIKKIS